MGILSIIMTIIWASVISNGVYALVKGYFFHEKEKVKKHDPNAYRKWIKISGVLLLLCGVINVVFSIKDGFADVNDYRYIIYIIITVAVVIAALSLAYVCIVKPADKALGIESEFDKIFKEKK